MFYKSKVAVCSEIRTKHINAMWAPRRIFGCYTWRYVKLPLGFKRLITRCGIRTHLRFPMLYLLQSYFLYFK
jgi:hypothetical protein